MDEQTLKQASTSWYKLPIVWFVIAVPSTAILLGMVMLWLAVDSDDGLVADDYYKRGLAINKSLQRDKSALDYGLAATIELNNANGIIRMNFTKGKLADYPATIQLKCLHATRAGLDVIVDLHHGIDDQYIGHLQKSLLEGVWNMELSHSGWRLQQRLRITGLDRFGLTL